MRFHREVSKPLRVAAGSTSGESGRGKRQLLDLPPLQAGVMSTCCCRCSPEALWSAVRKRLLVGPLYIYCLVTQSDSGGREHPGPRQLLQASNATSEPRSRTSSGS